MNKNRLSTIFLAFIVVGISYAADLTPEQKRFRTSLNNFLKEEGFVPTIDDEDNSLNFKKEGTLYWISFGGENPIYLEFHRAGLKCEDADKSLVLQSVNAANRKVRCAKAMFNDTSVSFAIEMYCHSAEEFKYIFYKCLKELDNIRDEVSEYYNGNPSSGNSGTYSSNYSSDLLQKFFPVYGITLGKTSISELKAMGYAVKTDDDGDSVGHVKDLALWDFNHDNIFEQLYVIDSDQLPERWINLGINWNLSYNQIIDKFKGMGFNITKKEGPTTKEYSGRKTLSAKVTLTAPGGKFTIELKFDYGNDHNEGYSVNSANSLYSMRFNVK